MNGYFLFCFIKGAADGGMDDHIESFPTLREAEQFLISDRLHRGYRDRAHISCIDATGDLCLVGTYEHSRTMLNDEGVKVRGNKHGSGRWLKELDDDTFAEVVTLHVE